MWSIAPRSATAAAPNPIPSVTRSAPLGLVVELAEGDADPEPVCEAAPVTVAVYSFWQVTFDGAVALVVRVTSAHYGYNGQNQ